MSPPKQRHGGQHKRRQAPRAETVDFWHADQPLPELEPITPTPDPTALMQSLGELPINDDPNTRYVMATVIDRSAKVAEALALTAGLLADR